MTSELEDLREEHQKLVTKIDENRPLEELIQEIEAFMKRVRKAGDSIGDDLERDLLRSFLRYWGAYVYRHTSVYPNTELLPYTHISTSIDEAGRREYLKKLSRIIALFRQRLFLLTVAKLAILVAVVAAIIWLVYREIETTLPASILPPLPAQINNDFESTSSYRWEPQEFSNSQAIIAVTPKHTLGASDTVLELTVSLSAPTPNRKQGEVLADLRYKPILFWVSKQPPVDMSNTEITCWIYAPTTNLENSDVQIFAKSLGDENAIEPLWWSEYGSPVVIQANKWFTATLTLSTLAPSDGYIDLRFDPKAVVAIGLRIRANSEIEYDGPIYINACSW